MSDLEKKINKTSEKTQDKYSNEDSMKTYMNDIGKVALLTIEEEKNIADRIRGEDLKESEKAKKHMIEANLRLVVKIAHDFKGLGLPIQDLISEGNIGLMRATDKYKRERGAKFSSYAAWWIKQSMRRALGNQSRTIRIPVQSAGKMNKIKKARLEFKRKYKREPSDKDLAKVLDMSERSIKTLGLYDNKIISLEEPIQQGENGILLDLISDETSKNPFDLLSKNGDSDRALKLLQNLDEREYLIIVKRFGLDGNSPKTLEEISQELGRTRERVRQIQNVALSKIRHHFFEKKRYIPIMNNFKTDKRIKNKQIVENFSKKYKTNENLETKIISPKDNIDQIIEVYCGCKDINEVAKITGYSISTCNKYLKKEGIIPDNTRIRRKLNKYQITNKIFKKILNNETINLTKDEIFVLEHQTSTNGRQIFTYQKMSKLLNKSKNQLMRIKLNAYEKIAKTNPQYFQ